MKTTSLIVEMLVVGVLGALVLVPAYAATSGASLDTVLASIGRLSLIVQLALAYALGILWNRLCNAAFSWPEGLVRSTLSVPKQQNQHRRIQLSRDASPLNDYLAATRGMIRVTRAASLLLLVYFGFGVFEIPTLSLEQGLVLQPPPLESFLLLGLAVFSWWRLYRGYLLTIQDSVSESADENRADG